MSEDKYKTDRDYKIRDLISNKLLSEVLCEEVINICDNRFNYIIYEINIATAFKKSDTIEKQISLIELSTHIKRFLIKKGFCFQIIYGYNNFVSFGLSDRIYFLEKSSPISEEMAMVLLLSKFEKVTKDEN